MSANWLTLERLWNRVLSRDELLGTRTGGWKVEKEYSGEGLTPIAGDPDEIAIYYNNQEIARWPLSNFVGDSAENVDGGSDE